MTIWRMRIARWTTKATQKHTHTLSLSLSRTHTLSLSHAHTLSLAHTHTHTQSQCVTLIAFPLQQCLQERA